MTATRAGQGRVIVCAVTTLTLVSLRSRASPRPIPTRAETRQEPLIRPSVPMEIPTLRSRPNEPTVPLSAWKPPVVSSPLAAFLAPRFRTRVTPVGRRAPARDARRKAIARLAQPISGSYRYLPSEGRLATTRATSPLLTAIGVTDTPMEPSLVPLLRLPVLPEVRS